VSLAQTVLHVISDKGYRRTGVPPPERPDLVILLITLPWWGSDSEKSSGCPGHPHLFPFARFEYFSVLLGITVFPCFEITESRVQAFLNRVVEYVSVVYSSYYVQAMSAVVHHPGFDSEFLRFSCRQNQSRPLCRVIPCIL
jgi:hypothetical protein